MSPSVNRGRSGSRKSRREGSTGGRHIGGNEGYIEGGASLKRWTKGAFYPGWGRAVAAEDRMLAYPLTWILAVLTGGLLQAALARTI